MIRDMEKIPYWYQESVNEISPKITYSARIITDEEIINGMNYLKKKDILINQANLTKLLGYNFFSSYNQLKQILNKLLLC